MERPAERPPPGGFVTKEREGAGAELKVSVFDGETDRVLGLTVLLSSSRCWPGGPVFSGPMMLDVKHGQPSEAQSIRRL